MTWNDASVFLLTVGCIGIAVYGLLLLACWLALGVVKRWVDLGPKSGERSNFYGNEK